MVLAKSETGGYLPVIGMKEGPQTKESLSEQFDRWRKSQAQSWREAGRQSRVAGGSTNMYGPF
jgi:hypothetical protein